MKTKPRIPQRLLVLDHLAEHGGITPQDALVKFGCQRLAARILDLREDNWWIDREDIHSPNGRVTSRYKMSPLERKAARHFLANRA
jgi:hypothetical protein